MKNVLVTGGAGFIGSNFVRYLLKISDNTIPNQSSEVTKSGSRGEPLAGDWGRRTQGLNLSSLVNLDALTYAGNLGNLRGVEGEGYTFVRGDICDADLLDELFSRYEIDTVVNFAAESHVDRSISDPSIFLTTNVIGTQRLLEAARKHWAEGGGFRTGVRFLQVSTDEVYGRLGKTGVFTETTPIAPNSPYSASKAGADMFVRAYHETYGLPVNITRCSNNYGPYQFPEKFIPLIINNCKNDKPLPVYGDGLQVRDWLHVWDHCSAIHAVLTKGRSGEIYNIGGNNEWANIDIVNLIIKSMGKSKDLIRHVADRPGHDRRYAMDNTKITLELDWHPSCAFEQGIEETIRWYIDNPDWLENVVSGAYVEYYDKMYKDR